MCKENGEAVGRCVIPVRLGRDELDLTEAEKIVQIPRKLCEEDCLGLVALLAKVVPQLHIFGVEIISREMITKYGAVEYII